MLGSFLLVLPLAGLVILVLVVFWTHPDQHSSHHPHTFHHYHHTTTSGLTTKNSAVSPNRLRQQSQEVLRLHHEQKERERNNNNKNDHSRAEARIKEEVVVDEPTTMKEKPEKEPLRKIPSVLIFTHSINLLNTSFDAATRQDDEEEDIALQRNVQNTIALHPNSTVRFLTDEDCVASIRRVMRDKKDNENANNTLAWFFQQESHGMYKADICRGAALYETGGYYMDVDLQARMSIPPILHPNTTFTTILVHSASHHRGNFFQAFIGSTPRNPILYRYLELFEMHYHGMVDVDGPLGVMLLRKAFDDVLGTRRHPKEEASRQQVELWQEVQYHPQLFPHVPPPTWGTRRACHFVVVANPEPPFVVPFYSRVAGSRMCGGKDSKNQKQHK